jgi:tetratricopeptide (TPR) repeat protein
VQGLAALYRRLERPGDALNVLNEAVAAQPVTEGMVEAWVEIHSEHALALSESGHHEDGISAILSLLNAKAGDPARHYFNLAGMLERVGRLDHCRDALERAIEASPRMPLYKERLADYLVKQEQDLDTALRLLIEANQVETTAGAGMLGGGGSKVTISPNRPRYLYKIARVYFLKGEDKEAERTITTALAVSRDPAVTEALEALRQDLKQASS